MEGALHRFPVKLSPSPLQPAAEEPFEVLDVTRAEELLRLVRGQLTKIGDLVVFMDDQRDEARRLGIESIAIELCALYEGGRLGAVRDELESAVTGRHRARITPEGMDYVHRVEKLLAKADGPLMASRRAEVPVPRNLLEGAPRLGVPVSTDTLIWGSVVMAGLVGVVLVVCHVVASPAEPKRVKMPQVDLRSGRKKRGSA